MSNWNGGARVSAVLITAGLGKWRYVIAGSLLAFLLFAVCRLIGSLTAPFGMRRRFSGICTETDGKNVCVRFQDARLITHTAAFSLPDSVPVRPGDPVRFAVRAEAFSADAYPHSLPEIGGGDEVVHIAAYRRELLNMLLKRGISGLLLCAAALAAFLAAVRLCFPAQSVF